MIKTLSLILQPFSIGFIILALAINQWNCGGLFESCLQHYRTISILLIIFFILGTTLLTIAFLFDFITICSESLDLNSSYFTVRIVILLSGLSCIISAILIYYFQFDRQFSRSICTVGIVFAAQVAILNLIISPCIHRNRLEPVVE
ncbi:unnamed protein product [Schistosoma turkestanicum]|nr:unnamed protein product [Schistosoma turkestanicum]